MPTGKIVSLKKPVRAHVEDLRRVNLRVRGYLLPDMDFVEQSRGCLHQDGPSVGTRGHFEAEEIFQIVNRESSEFAHEAQVGVGLCAVFKFGQRRLRKWIAAQTAHV